MIIVPAIDLKDGKCVRLLKGEEGSETVFSENPVETALKWEDCGAKWLHIVDLDGAFKGSAINFDIISDIADNVNCSIQIGGGIRDNETAERYISAGVDRLIIGTKAFSDSEFIKKLCDTYPGKVAVGLDTKNNRIAVKGWKEVLDLDVDKVIDELQALGVSMFIHTNVDKDGTMEGINVRPIESFVEKCSVPVIASGGIATIEDLEKLSSLDGTGLWGAILGKSIYSGSIDLKEAISRFNQ